MLDSTCYYQSPAGLHHGPEPGPGNRSMIPCGATGSAVQLCCWEEDVCLSDSICYSTHPSLNATGYYIGGCSDSSYSDPACSQHCVYRSYSDIVYNRTSELWACCQISHKTDLNCDVGTGQHFKATPPDQMREISVLSASTTPSSATSSPQTSTAATSSPQTSAGTSAFSGTTDTRGSTLSSGTVAHIVAGVLIPCVLIAAGVFLTRRLKRRNRVNKDRSDQAADHQSADVFTGGKPELDSRVWTELDGRALPAELDVRAPPAELDVRAPPAELDVRAPAELDARRMKCSRPATMISTSATLYITQRVDIRTQGAC
ncbi:hypothetical protein MMC07_008869 [Pseudocyphellaria aurata]|nr:hypothetical protein [Pseudocyphellaria aurata]